MNFEEYVVFAAHRLDELIRAGDYQTANRFLMETAPMFLSTQPDRIRDILYHKLFTRVGKNYRTQYQCYDFECVDYEMFFFSPQMPLLRGPQPPVEDLITGNYVTMMGAAQFFGRFHKKPLHKMIAERYKIPVLNLSKGGAGPLFFLELKGAIDAANRSRFVVLQVLSGRSIGCEEYPGERLTAPANCPDLPLRDRLEILSEIWSKSRGEAKRLIRKWSENYVNAYMQLIRAIKRPIVLVWVSARTPQDWNLEHVDKGPWWGAFPQLVTQEMVSTIAKECSHFIEGDRDSWLPHKVRSRVDGKDCPFFEPDGKLSWENNYYSSIEVHNDIFARIGPLAKSLGLPS
jgi:Domain of unknown function (DUF6473)